MIQTQKITRPDMLGATASGLCAIHCIATPLLFIANTCSVTGCIDTPVWWKLIDYFFLVISYIAIRASIKKSIKGWVGFALLSSWALLFLAIVNESFEVLALPEIVVYIPAFAMIALHLYNQKYCRCTGNNCCAN